MAAGNDKLICWLFYLLSFLPSGALNHVGMETVDRRPCRPVTISGAIAKGMNEKAKHDSPSYSPQAISQQDGHQLQVVGADY